jgi:hypothetical protein
LADDGEVEVFHLNSTGPLFIGTAHDDIVPESRQYALVRGELPEVVAD